MQAILLFLPLEMKRNFVFGRVLVFLSVLFSTQNQVVEFLLRFFFNNLFFGTILLSKQSFSVVDYA